MDSLYKVVKYFKTILANSHESESKGDVLNIRINRNNCDTLVKQGRFFNNRCIG